MEGVDPDVPGAVGRALDSPLARPVALGRARADAAAVDAASPGPGPLPRERAGG